MSKVWVVDSRNFVSGGQVRDGEDPSDRYASKEDSYSNYSIIGICEREKTARSLAKLNYSYSTEINVNFDPSKVTTVYVVKVIYETGDTFGRSLGHGLVEAVTGDPDEAVEIVNSIRDSTYKSPSGYLAWEGYFERLTDATVEVMPLIK